jgi:MFS superfamily sulfate permease-like transporter
MNATIAAGFFFLASVTSLVFAVLPSATTTTRVVAGITCATCLAIVFILLRKIRFDMAMQTLREEEEQIEKGLPDFVFITKKTPPLPLRKSEIPQGYAAGTYFYAPGGNSEEM